MRFIGGDNHYHKEICDDNSHRDAGLMRTDQTEGAHFNSIPGYFQTDWERD